MFSYLHLPFSTKHSNKIEINHKNASQVTKKAHTKAHITKTTIFAIDMNTN